MDEKNNTLERELRSMTESAKEKIRHITEDVYKRVAQTLNDEIKRYDDKISRHFGDEDFKRIAKFFLDGREMASSINL
jgi:hypothetical protein